MTKYRVTWKVFDENNKLQPREMTFGDIDQGYSYYQDLQKGRSDAFGATWNHIDDDDDDDDDD